MIIEKTHLTDAAVKKFAAPVTGNYAIHWDTEPGFGVRVTSTGFKAFIFNYRTRAGRERRYTIGSFPSWSATAARDKARQLRRLIDDGGDPMADIEAEREAPTVADLIARFEAEHLVRKRASTADAYRRILTLHVAPVLKHLKVAAVAYADIDALHRRVTKNGGPYVANRTHAVLSKMFALAIHWGMRDSNPAKGVERNTESKRRRYLNGDELARLTTALAKHVDQQMANIIRMLLLTGARRGEVLGMRWADLDLKTGTWTKPGSETKQKTEHTVPLSAPARQLLAELRDARPLGEFVFPGDGKSGHVVAIKKAWAAICKSAGIGGLRIHDLRHSFASQLASGGASLPLIGALLGHSNPTTTHRYAHLFDDPQRAAVEKVGAIIEAAAGAGGGATVKTFPPRGGRRGR